MNMFFINGDVFFFGNDCSVDNIYILFIGVIDGIDKIFDQGGKEWMGVVYVGKIVMVDEFEVLVVNYVFFFVVCVGGVMLGVEIVNFFDFIILLVFDGMLVRG